MLLIRSALYLILLFFIMQLDAYFYLLGDIDVEPFLLVLCATILVVTFYIFLKGRHISARLSKESIVLLLCFLLYISVQILGVTVWNTVPSDTIILAYWVYMTVLLLLGAISGALIGDRIPYVLFSLLTILVAVTVVDTLFGGVSINMQLDRSASTLRNPNMAAFVMVVLMLGSLRWQRQDLIEILSVIIAGVGIALTQSRGGLLAYLVTIICYSIWWGSLGRTSGIRAKRYLVAGLFGIATVSVVAAVLFTHRYGSDGMEYVLSAGSFESNARDHAVQVALELINEKPFFGHGTGFVYTQELGPHNMLLRAWVENGIPGFLGISALFLGLLWVGIARRDQSIITLAIVLSMLAMTTHNLTEARSILIVTGMLLANSARKKAAKRFLRIIPHDKRGVVTY